MGRYVLDLLFAAVLLVSSIYLWFVAEGFQKSRRYQDVDSDFWPQALMILIAVMAVVLIYQRLQALWTFRRNRRRGALQPGEASADPGLGWAKLLGAAALTVGYVAALRYVGFLLATLVFIAIAQNIVPYRNRMMKLAFPIAFTAIIAGLFIGVMGIALPRGAGPFYSLSLLFY